ncbi:MAG: exonuclease subunit SbcD [Leptolyngbyaceae bacterium]|nr:exonuclease subunit SbcD [Leptolyngbyaceae bacterium]
MSIRLLHLSDIHLGGGFCHGKTNPATGLNTRFEDFVRTLTLCIDRALGLEPWPKPWAAAAQPVDLVLFGGDAFPDATPPPLVQDAFAQQFRRLAEAGIPTVMLVGNHDQYAQGQGGSSLSLYRTLGIPGIVVGDRLQTHAIHTRGGPVQVITVPWLSRSTLLTREDTEGLSLSALHERLLDRLRVALEGEIRQLRPDVPTILLGHLMVDTARFGAERFLAMGKGLTIPLTLLHRDCFDYVALGHVHRHQVLATHPPVVYPGSIERVDFSEEKEEKGVVLADIGGDQTVVQFWPLPGRSFCTVRVDLAAIAQTTANDPLQLEPQGSQSSNKLQHPLQQHLQHPLQQHLQQHLQQQLMAAIATAPIDDAVLRVIYRVSPDQLDAIDLSQLTEILSRAHTYTIQPELTQQRVRPRLPDLAMGTMTDPIEALTTYLKHHPELAEWGEDMIATAHALQTQLEVSDRSDDRLYSSDMNVDNAAPVVAETVDQLRLL